MVLSTRPLKDGAPEFADKTMKRRRAVGEESQNEIDSTVIMKQSKACALRDFMADGHLADRWGAGDNKKHRRMRGSSCPDLLVGRSAH